MFSFSMNEDFVQNFVLHLLLHCILLLCASVTSCLCLDQVHQIHQRLHLYLEICNVVVASRDWHRTDLTSHRVPDCTNTPILKSPRTCTRGSVLAFSVQNGPIRTVLHTSGKPFLHNGHPPLKPLFKITSSNDSMNLRVTW